MNVFRGRRNQRGTGFGAVFASWLKRNAVPLLSKGLRYLTGKLATTGVNVAHDIHQGVRIGEAFKNRFKEAGHNIKSEVGAKVNKVLNGEGMLARRLAMRKRNKKKKKTCKPLEKKNKKPNKRIKMSTYPTPRFDQDLF